MRHFNVGDRVVVNDNKYDDAKGTIQDTLFGGLYDFLVEIDGDVGPAWPVWESEIELLEDASEKVIATIGDTVIVEDPTPIEVLDINGDAMPDSEYDSVANPNETTVGFKRDLGKPRMDLVDPKFIEGLAKVLTYGSDKYDKSMRVHQNNWRQGMRWGRVYAALQRHLQTFWNGEDVDDESGLLHLEHAAFGVMALHYYMRRFPQGDDRDLSYRNIPRIGLDVDGVICDTYGSALSYASDLGLLEPNSVWANGEMPHYEFPPELREAFTDGTFDADFYLNLEPLSSGSELAFEPVVYVTARRGIGLEVLPKWLGQHGFPSAPVVSTAQYGSKAEPLSQYDVEWFVEDHFKYFREIEDAGIACFIYDQPYNRKYDVGMRRIENINDIIAQ